MDTAGMAAEWARIPPAEAVMQVVQFVGSRARPQAIRAPVPLLRQAAGDQRSDRLGGEGGQPAARTRPQRAQTRAQRA